jgi:hypothetical protein
MAGSRPWKNTTSDASPVVGVQQRAWKPNGRNGWSPVKRWVLLAKAGVRGGGAVGPGTPRPESAMMRMVPLKILERVTKAVGWNMRLVEARGPVVGALGAAGAS